MWGWIAGRILSFGLGRALAWAAAAAASAALLWLWNDYQDAKASAARLTAEIEEAVAIQRDTVRLAALYQAQLRHDLAAARETSARRAAEGERLAADLAAVRDTRRPDDEMACPVHPAFGVARRRLLEARGDRPQGD